MQNKFFDIGANLTHPSLNKGLDLVLKNSIEKGVTRISITGTDLEEGIKAKEICENSSYDLISTAGIHPHQAKTFNDQTFSQLKDLFNSKCVKAVGETGLDFHRNYSSPKEQEISFKAHLDFAIDNGFPLFLHIRDSHKRFMEIVKPFEDKISKAVVHCFTGNKQELYDYLEMGFYIGITGWIMDERRGYHLKDLIKDIPLDRLMIETDAPYLIPRIPDLKQERINKPEYLPLVADEVCLNRLEEKDKVIDAIYLNSMEFFNLT